MFLSYKLLPKKINFKLSPKLYFREKFKTTLFLIFSYLYRALSRHRLREHVHSIHENSNICSFCGKNFATRSNLKAHVEYLHEGKKKTRLNCTMCDANFSQPVSLKNHMETGVFL